MRILVCALAVGILWVSLGCESSSTLNPSPTLNGRWRGPISGDRRGPGTLETTFTQAASSLTGSWTTTFPTTPGNTGILNGTVTGSSASLFLAPETPITCAPDVTMSGTLSVTAKVSGSHLVGTYLVFLCEGTASGTIDLVHE